MTDEQALAFLVEKPRTAKLATVRPDGRPHITPIWIDVDGDTVVFTTWHESVKAANLRHDPRASLCVDDEQPPFAYVIIEGEVAVDEDPDTDELYRWAARISGRYMGQELAEQFGRRNAVAGEVLVRIRPTKIIGRAGIAD